MVDFDFLTPAIILGFAGLVTGVMFQLFRERRDRKEEKRKQIERDEAQRKAFADQVKTTVENQANLLNERLDDKLEVIRVTTSGLKTNFEEFKTVNRDEILSIKREIEKLKEEANELNKQVQSNEIDKREVENRMNTIKNQIYNLEQRINSVEIRVSNRDGISSTK